MSIQDILSKISLSQKDTSYNLSHMGCPQQTEHGHKTIFQDQTQNTFFFLPKKEVSLVAVTSEKGHF